MKKLALLILGVVFLYSCQQEKTAYVDNDLLNKNYSDLKTSNEKFNDKQQELQSELQEQGQAFQKKVMKYQDEKDNMSEAVRKKQEDSLMQEQQQLRQKQQMQQSVFMQQKKNEQDSLKDILKDKIKDYANAHNYTYIFGLNDDNLMYADDSKDITQDILDELNNGDNSDSGNNKDNGGQPAIDTTVTP